jgi:hypothetical protein
MESEKKLVAGIEQADELAGRGHGIAKACSIMVEAMMATHPDKKELLSHVLRLKEQYIGLNPAPHDEMTGWWLNILLDRLSAQVQKH